MQETVISSISTEYFWLPVIRSGVDSAFLITLPVKFAFTSSSRVKPSIADESEWTDGSWEVTPVYPVARCKVGPDGGKVLAIGRYTVWARIEGADEKPAKAVGLLRIT